MKQRTVVALGFFDGVHLGHAALLRTARARADALGLPAMAMTFDIHPSTFIRGMQMPLLYSREDREALLRQQGMDEVVFLPFDRAMMQMPWESFLDNVLVGSLNAARLVCGYDYHFGYRGEGTAEKLQEVCARRGIGCDIIERIELDGIAVSSSQIRQLIVRGNVSEAQRFLGRPHFLCGRVIHGSALGRTLGTPTANILIPPEILMPKRGVYITRADTPEGSFPAVTNIGCRPTVDGEGVSVEAWLLDYSGDLYGRDIRLTLCEYLRPERKFDTLSELRTEILQNADQTRSYFSADPNMESEECI